MGCVVSTLGLVVSGQSGGSDPYCCCKIQFLKIFLFLALSVKNHDPGRVGRIGLLGGLQTILGNLGHV